jgi:voltage-gated potassium channel
MQSREAVKRHWRLRLHDVVFENDTPAGKAFDIAVLGTIVLSVFAVLLESVASIRAFAGDALRAAEWSFTILFTIEYILRLICVGRPFRYFLSFFGLVDLLAILPTYLSLVVPGTQTLLVIRALRLLRVFRVLKLGNYIGAARSLGVALRASRQKITVFLTTVLTIVVIVGALMYLIEGEANGFSSIPISIYWAIVTMTTVGYGDIAPLNHSRSARGFGAHDYRLRDHCRSHGNHHGGTGASHTTGHVRCMCRLRPPGTRQRRPALQVLWRGTRTGRAGLARRIDLFPSRR